MRPTTAALALLGATLVIAPSASFAQTGSAPAPAARAPDAPVAGANSFTEGQARSRIEGAGYSNVGDLRKDDQGVWRGQAMRNGSRTEVALDYQGNVVAGAAARGAAARSNSGSGGTTSAASPRDGTPGNPPSTATGRAVDRAQGQTPRPDGTPGNPPGTAAGRAVDRTLGTNSTGANPQGQGAVSGGTPAR
jgi:opacity protein-like surface antigen